MSIGGASHYAECGPRCSEDRRAVIVSSVRRYMSGGGGFCGVLYRGA